MKTKLGRVVILVDDCDKAFNFYETNFFCHKLYDDNAADGTRLLHIAFSADQGMGVWLMKADSEKQKLKIGKQTGDQPTLVIYTDDLEALYYHLQGNFVQILQPIAIARDNNFFHCLDLYGNKLTVLEV